MKSDSNPILGGKALKLFSFSFFKCLSVILRGLEKLIEYLTYNTYTIVNIDGTSFCKSVKKVLEIIVQNPLRIIAINTLGDLVLFLAKVLVTLLNTLIAVFMLKLTHYPKMVIKYS